jgi:ACT domain-containing protein
LKTFDKLTAPVDFDKIIPQVIDLTIKTHKKHAKMHEVLHSLASTDEAVNSQFIALEDSITVKIADKLSALGENIENAMEKIHFAMDIIQSFSHEYIFDKHDYIDYFILREMVNDTIINLFKK